MVGSLGSTYGAIATDEDLENMDYESLWAKMDEAGHDDEIDPKDEYASIMKPESRVRWVENKVYIMA